MSIEINNLAPTAAHKTADETKLNQSTEQPVAERESGKSSTGDTVSLSDNAVQLGKINSTVTSPPVMDMQRIEALKKAISDGSYEVDPVKVADKLMEFESMLKQG